MYIRMLARIISKLVTACRLNKLPVLCFVNRIATAHLTFMADSLVLVNFVFDPLLQSTKHRNSIHFQ